MADVALEVLGLPERHATSARSDAISVLQWWAFWCTATITSSSAVHYKTGRWRSHWFVTGPSFRSEQQHHLLWIVGKSSPASSERTQE